MTMGVVEGLALKRMNVSTAPMNITARGGRMNPERQPPRDKAAVSSSELGGL